MIGLKGNNLNACQLEGPWVGCGIYKRTCD